MTTYIKKRDNSDEVKVKHDEKQTVESNIQEIERKIPKKFELLKLGTESGKCRCRSCNQVISLMPERGNYLNNIEAHMKSCSPGKRGEKRMQSSIEGFFQARKKAKTQ